MDWNLHRPVFALLLSAALPLPGLLANEGHDDHPAPKPDAPPPAASAPTASAAADLATVKLLQETALSLLKEGNVRFKDGHAQHPHLERDWRKKVAQEGQHPLATVLTCSDSRAPVELVFDRGIGDLFVVRVAGNVATDSGLGSIEYGVGHLRTPLLIVLGHTRCGAVTAVAQDAELHGHLPIIANEIKPAVETAKKAPGSDLINQAIRANVQLALDNILDRCPEIRERVQQGLVALQGAVYDLDTGAVEWLPASAPAISFSPRKAVPAVEEHHAEPAHEEAKAEEAEHHDAPPAKPGKEAHAAPAPATAHAHDDEDAALAVAPKPAPPVAQPFKAPPKRAEEPLMRNAPISSSSPIGGPAPSSGHKSH